MKTLLIIIVVFVIGFFLAKNLYENDTHNQINTEEKAPVKQGQNEVKSEIKAEEVQPESTNQPPQLDATDSTKKIISPKNRPTYKKNTDNHYIPDQKMKDYEKQLDQLDEQINNDLDKLRANDTKSTEGLIKNINKKPEGLMPGDDEHTEKEYQ